MTYYKTNAPGARPLGRIDLGDAVRPSGKYVEHSPTPARPETIVLFTKKRTYFFAVESREERVEWIGAITGALESFQAQKK